MRTSWGVLVAVVGVMGGVLGGGAFTDLRAASQGPQEAGPREVGIRGEVARGAAEDSCVIKVCFGKKKVIAYEVAPESPRRRDLLPLLGKTVEATGVMKKGPAGENLIVVTAVAEAVAQK